MADGKFVDNHHAWAAATVASVLLQSTPGIFPDVTPLADADGDWTPSCVVEIPDRFGGGRYEVLVRPAPPEK